MDNTSIFFFRDKLKIQDVSTERNGLEIKNIFEPPEWKEWDSKGRHVIILQQNHIF